MKVLEHAPRTTHQVTSPFLWPGSVLHFCPLKPSWPESPVLLSQQAQGFRVLKESPQLSLHGAGDEEVNEARLPPSWSSQSEREGDSPARNPMTLAFLASTAHPSPHHIGFASLLARWSKQPSSANCEGLTALSTERLFNLRGRGRYMCIWYCKDRGRTQPGLSRESQKGLYRGGHSGVLKGE